jgi:uncharacterized protein (UPF0276 family)
LTPPRLGLGIGWRPELALAISRHPGLGFVELIAEDFWSAPLPLPVEQLRGRGLAVIPHGISLSPGGAGPPDLARVRRLGDLAKRCGAPLVSEHLCFVRAGGVESGHLLPLPRTRQMLDVVVENLRLIRANLPVPLAVENISAHFDWPGAEWSEPAFLREVVTRADVGLLLDIANVHANAVNLGLDPAAFLDALPLERVAYCHIAGGVERDGVYHDTHTRRTSPEALALLEELAARIEVPGVLLERDDDFPSEDELRSELDDIARALARGGRRREAVHVG